MKSIEKSLVEERKVDSTTWGWSTEDKQSVLFRFEGQSASVEWSWATFSLDWSKEIEKTLN